MGLIGPPHFSRSRREEAAALRAALARAVVPRGTGQVGARVRLLGRPGESEGCARVSEGWLAKKVVAWAYEPITDSRISPPMHTRVLMISARVARESAKMHLRNMGYAWSSSIVSTCFLSLCACVSEPHGSQPKIEVPRRTLALPPVRRPDAPRDVGRSEARTLLSTAHTLANLSPDLGSSGTNRRREVGWGCWVGRFATHAAKKEGLRVWGTVRTFSGRSSALSCTIDLCWSSGSVKT